jgi:hypothetical protein
MEPTIPTPETEQSVLLRIFRAQVTCKGEYCRRNIEIIFSLVEAGLVTNNDPESGRGNVLYLTPKGLAQLCRSLAPQQ